VSVLSESVPTENALNRSVPIGSVLSVNVPSRTVLSENVLSESVLSESVLSENALIGNVLSENAPIGNALSENVLNGTVLSGSERKKPSDEPRRRSGGDKSVKSASASGRSRSQSGRAAMLQRKLAQGKRRKPGDAEQRLKRMHADSGRRSGTQRSQPGKRWKTGAHGKKRKQYESPGWMSTKKPDFRRLQTRKVSLGKRVPTSSRRLPAHRHADGEAQGSEDLMKREIGVCRNWSAMRRRLLGAHDAAFLLEEGARPLRLQHHRHLPEGAAVGEGALLLPICRSGKVRPRLHRVEHLLTHMLAEVLDRRTWRCSRVHPLSERGRDRETHTQTRLGAAATIRSLL